MLPLLPLLLLLRLPRLGRARGEVETGGVKAVTEPPRGGKAARAAHAARARADALEAAGQLGGGQKGGDGWLAHAKVGDASK